jgi:large conductance mechanosensitive channel
MGMLKEFRDFAMRGNVADMAVGIIIGGAFGGIVKSLVDDIVMPVVGIAGKADFSNLYFGLTEETRNEIARVIRETGSRPALAKARELGTVLAYGNFLTILVNFLIIAFCVFMLVKAINTARRTLDREIETAKAPPEAPADIKLLTEIRDLLKRA